MRHVTPDLSLPAGPGLIAQVVVTDRRHGDLAVSQPPDQLAARRRRIVDAPWSWLHQVHGAGVHVVTHPGDAAGSEGDALCTRVVGAPLAVQVADCAPVCLIGDCGVIGVVHAGWRGLAAGVLDATVATMAGMNAGDVVAVLGPCIGPAAYEFGAEDLDRMAAALGASVRSVTAEGRPALDVPAAVAAALNRHDIPLVARIGGCTASEADRRWSHRARGDAQRQALVAWIAHG